MGADRAAQLWGHDSVPIFTRQDLETRHEAPCKLIEMRSGDAVHAFTRASRANLWAIIAFRVGYAIRTYIKRLRELFDVLGAGQISGPLFTIKRSILPEGEGRRAGR